MATITRVFTFLILQMAANTCSSVPPSHGISESVVLLPTLTRVPVDYIVPLESTTSNNPFPCAMDLSIVRQILYRHLCGRKELQAADMSINMKE
jgi:hypothetical protein